MVSDSGCIHILTVILSWKKSSVLCDTDNLEQNLLVEIINAKHNIDAGNTIENKKVIENKPYSSEEYYDGFVTMISKILEWNKNINEGI